jgi:hypothetical protein
LPPPTPLPTRLVAGNPDIGIVEKDTPYLITTQPAIWGKEFLFKILVPGFSAWDFEHMASTMCEFIDVQIWGSIKPCIAYEQGIEKGKWKPSALETCYTCGWEVDLKARPVFSVAELDVHLNSSSPTSRAHNQKMASIQSYQAGNRVNGNKNILSFIALKPFSIQGWVILISGLLGAQVLRVIRNTHLKYKIYNARRRSLGI